MKGKNIAPIAALILLFAWVINFQVANTNILNTTIFVSFPIINLAISVIFKKQNKILNIFLVLAVIQLIVVAFMWYVGSQIG